MRRQHRRSAATRPDRPRRRVHPRGHACASEPKRNPECAEGLAVIDEHDPHRRAPGHRPARDRTARASTPRAAAHGRTGPGRRDGRLRPRRVAAARAARRRRPDARRAARRSPAPTTSAASATNSFTRTPINLRRARNPLADQSFCNSPAPSARTMKPSTRACRPSSRTNSFTQARKSSSTPRSAAVSIWFASRPSPVSPSWNFWQRSHQRALLRLVQRRSAANLRHRPPRVRLEVPPPVAPVHGSLREMVPS